MATVELFERLSLALAIGLLIGIERGWQTREEAEGERSVGLRTLALSGLLGGIWAAVAQAVGPGGGFVLAAAYVVFGATIVLFRYRETSLEGTLGATTAIASLLTFALGAYAVLGDKAAAGACGVVVAVLLALKSVLHAWVKRLSWIELRSALVLLAMTFVALPILPRRPIDPWGAVNPFEIWLLTVMLAVDFIRRLRRDQACGWSLWRCADGAGWRAHLIDSRDVDPGPHRP
ncbi:MAG: MgtC/SapB family protein [Hyphomicrobiaceae bacterium]